MRHVAARLVHVDNAIAEHGSPCAGGAAILLDPVASCVYRHLLAVDRPLRLVDGVHDVGQLLLRLAKRDLSWELGDWCTGSAGAALQVTYDTM